MINKNKLKRLSFKLHKYLGFATGIIVFIVSITGALWVFNKEISHLIDGELVISKEDGPILTPTQAHEIAQTVFPDKHIHGTLYQNKYDAIEVIFYEGKPKFYQSVFLHPINGNVLKIEDHVSGFFAFVLEGHTKLWLPNSIGGNIVGTSVLLFLLILISGMILWWPKKNNYTKRLKFSWKETTKWKKKNIDLHSIIGFYIFFLAFILALTGSVMAYDWFYYIVFKSVGGTSAPQFIIPNGSSNSFNIDDTSKPIDLLIEKLKNENPDAVNFEVHYPPTDSSSIYVEISREEGVTYSSDYRFFDQHTMEEIETPSIYGKYENADFSDTVIRMNYDIHIGAIAGLPGKIIAFLTSLFSASLPLSGFLLWWGKKKR